MALDMVNKPLRVTNHEREFRLGLTASSLDQFEERVRAKMDIDSELTLRVVLECDGTEIDDEDYFATLDPHTCLMVLVQEQRWTPYKSNFILGLAVESENGSSGSGEGDGNSPVEELIWRLHQDLSFFPWLTLEELERIAKMDREEMRTIVPDPNFLEFLQTLCERYLQEKDSMSTNPPNGCNPNPPRCSTSSILNDPLKLIRLYSKFNQMKAQNGYFSFSSCGSEESLASLHSQNRSLPMGKNGDVASMHQNNLPHPRPTTPRQQQS